MGATGPHDRCQFSRHFERTEVDCPAFQRAQFIAATSYGKPLGTHVACSHLAVGELNTNQFYPRCSLGSHIERARWLAAMGPARIEVQRALGAEFEKLYPDSLRKLIAAKADALAESPDSRISRLALAVAVREFVAEFSAFVSAHARRIAELGISPSDLTARAAAVIGEWQHSSRLDLPGVDEESIRRPEVNDQVAAAAGLMISRLANSSTLILVGSIDQANLAALDQALVAALSSDARLSIDLSAVTFCSVAGMRTLTRAMETGRVTLIGMQPPLLRGLDAAGLSAIDAGDAGTDLEVAS